MFAHFFSSRSRVLALAALVFAGLSSAGAQSLRFAPPLFGVSAANGTNNAVNLLNGPTGLAVDAAGDLFIADTNNRVIRKVSPTQTATIFAGNGGFGYTGDTGLAINASMKQPTALAVDLAGNVYVADPQNFAVRKIDASGIITTFAGGNGSGSSGDGGLATSAKIAPAGLATDALGNVYIADTIGKSVRIVGTGNIIYTYAGGGAVPGDAANGGPALSAQLNSPSSLAMDSAGNLYIGDSGNFNVRRVDTAGVIHPFAGTSGVQGSTGDGGPAVNATIGLPYALAADPAGNIYITSGISVRVVNQASIISSVVGAGFTSIVLDGVPADHAPISTPRGLAADNFGNLYLAVTSANDVYEVNLHPEVFPQTRIGTSSQPQRLILENTGAASVKLSSFTFSGDFALWNNFLANNHACTQTVNITTGFSNYCTLDVVFTPTAEGIRSFPLTIVSNDTPGTLVETLTSTALSSALSMTSGQMFIVAGKYSTTGSSGPAATGPTNTIALTTPSGLAVDPSGNIYFSEDPYCLIERVDGLTGIQTIYGGSNALPCKPNDGHTVISGDGGAATSAYIPSAGPMALDSQNNLYIADGYDGRIRKIDTAGNITTFAGTGVGVGFSSSCGYTADGGQASLALLCGNSSMFFDAAGNLFFVETGTSLVRRISPAGVLTTVAGTFNGSFYGPGGGFGGDGGAATSAHLNQPQGIVVNSAGDIFIADTQNQVIRKVTAATGKVSTIAGQAGNANYSGDGGPATASTLNFPMGLAIDAAGNVFVSDYSNWVIRKIDTAGVITTVAGNHLSNFFNGDGLPATESNLNFPNFIFSNAGGHLYISDEDHELIREVSPNASLLFQPRMLGTTSASQSVTVANIGNLPLHFDAQAPTGITGDFAVSGTTCNFNASLSPGASCSVSVTFTPTVFGARSGILAFSNDGVASPQYVSLSGVGTAPQPQTIHFTAIPNHVYGDQDFNVSASTNSGLPLTFTVQSGNATITGSSVHITGVGPVTIAADQPGSAGAWLPAAEVTQSFTIARGNLVLTAQNANSTIGVPLAALTYSVTGFVYGETAAVLSGAPSVTSTVTPAGPAGFYPINIAIGTLTAADYTFSFVNGVYTMNAYVPPVKLAATATVAHSDTYVVTVTVVNSGTATAQNVVLNTVKLNATAGGPTPRVMPDIPAGGFATATISVPISAGVSGASAVGQILGTYSGGSFGGSFRVTLP